MIKRDISRLEVIAIVMAVSAVMFAALLRGQQAAPAAPSTAQTQTAKPGELGYTDTPMIPGLPYHVHDPARPRPPIVTPAAMPGGAPSDAIVLFDGKDLSKWSQRGPNGDVVDAKWPVRDGYFETGAKTGSMMTRDNFGSIQLHVEWAAPTPPAGTSQGRGNSRVILMFEVDGRPLLRAAESTVERVPMSIRLGRRRTPSAIGYVERHHAPLPEDHQGIAISTFGKVIKRQAYALRDSRRPPGGRRNLGFVEDLLSSRTSNPWMATGARESGCCEIPRGRRGPGTRRDPACSRYRANRRACSGRDALPAALHL